MYYLTGMEPVAIMEAPIDIDALRQAVTLEETGGQVVFVGTVRNATKGRRVQYLDFEAYKPMALSEMQKIVTDATQRWQLHGMMLHHRLGTVPIGAAAVVIACSAPHRKAAFAACEYAIDTLKETVPIWKKEVFEDGEVWVSAHP